MRKYLLLMIVIIFTACSQSVDLEGSVVTYEELSEKIAEKEDDLDKASRKLEEKEKELADIQKELEESESKISLNKATLEKLETLAANEKEMNENVEKSESKLKELKSKIKEKEKELEDITEVVRKTGDEPISLGAGHFVVGEDIPSGRYEAFPDGRGSNFVVYDSSGRLSVNTILGGRVPSYVFTAGDGYEIENNAPAKLVPIE